MHGWVVWFRTLSGTWKPPLSVFMAPSWWCPTCGHILLKCVLLLWITLWRLEALQTWDIIMIRVSPIALSTLCWLAYLMQVLITARERGHIFNPFCQSEEIYLSTSNESRQGEGKYGQESATLDETVMSGGVGDKKEKNQRRVTEHSQQHLQVKYDATGHRVLPS